MAQTMLGWNSDFLLSIIKTILRQVDSSFIIDALVWKKQQIIKLWTFIIFFALYESLMTAYV